MSVFDFGKAPKTTSELEEENEQLRVENENEELKLSLEQKKKLRENGLSLKNFGNSVQSALKWLKSH
jgi:hypothetical protein